MGKSLSKCADNELSQELIRRIEEYGTPTAFHDREQKLMEKYLDVMREISDHRMTSDHSRFMSIWSTNVKVCAGSVLHLLVFYDNETLLRLALELFLPQYGLLRTILNDQQVNVFEYAKRLEKTKCFHLLEAYEGGWQLEEGINALKLQLDEEKKGRTSQEQTVTVSMDADQLDLLYKMLHSPVVFWPHRITNHLRPIPFLWGLMLNVKNKKTHKISCECFRLLRLEPQDFEGLGFTRLEDTGLEEKEMLALWTVFVEVALNKSCAPKQEKVLEHYAIRSGVFVLMANHILRITLAAKTKPWTPEVVKHMNALFHAPAPEKLVESLHQLQGDVFITAFLEMLLHDADHYPDGKFDGKLTNLLAAIYRAANNTLDAKYDAKLVEMIRVGLRPESPSSEEGAETMLRTIRWVDHLMENINFRQKLIDHKVVEMVRDVLREQRGHHVEVVKSAVHVFYVLANAHNTNQTSNRTIQMVKSLAQLEVPAELLGALKDHFDDVVECAVNALVIIFEHANKKIKGELEPLQIELLCANWMEEYKDNQNHLKNIEKLLLAWNTKDETVAEE